MKHAVRSIRPKRKIDHRPLPDQSILSSSGRTIATVMSAVSSSAGKDCILHALLLKHLLQTQGVESELVIGHAAWRYGPDDSAVVAHLPEAESMSKGDFAGHAWVEVRGYIILDCTLWSLPEKIRILETIDGRRTTNRWKFPVLLAKKVQVSDFERVRDGRGLAAFYARDDELRAAILPRVEDPDRHILAAVEIVHANPGMKVVRFDGS